MPKLAFLLACEKSIIERDTQLVSMISLLTNMKVAIATSEPPPENAVAPKEWSIVSGWDGEDGDDEMDLDQVIEVILPDGKPFVKNYRTAFKVQKDRRHHVAAKIQGFPVGKAGRCHIQAWAEAGGRVITEKSSLYIQVEHEKVPFPPINQKIQ